MVGGGCVGLDPSQIHHHHYTRFRKLRGAMDPNIQLVLDELKGMRGDFTHLRGDFTDLQGSLTSRIDGVERVITNRFTALEDAAKVFDDWKPRVDAAMEDLRQEVGVLRKSVHRVVLDASPSTSAGILPQPVAAAAIPSAGHPVVGPDGHRVELHHRESGSHTHLPVKGTPPPSAPYCSASQPLFSFPLESNTESMVGAERSSFSSNRLPKMNFPSFDGENPKLWISRCEDYFDMYSVEPYLWVKIAGMNMTAAAARWLQSVGPSVRRLPWQHFCQLLLDRFGKDQHQLLIRQLFSIHQSGSVSEYIEQFSGLVDQLIAYSRNTDPIFYAMRFVDGLRGDIKAAVHLHRPANLDSACALALLQEEVGDSSSRREARKTDTGWSPRQTPRGPPPLPLPPRPDKPGVPSSSTDERRIRSVDDKLALLRSSRRARGLCIRCAEKWTRDHHCPKNIQARAIQEVWDLCWLEEDSVEESDSLPEDHVDTQLCLALSVSAIKGSAAGRSIQFQGLLQGHEVLILVDSGSSHSFVSRSLAASLVGQSSFSPPVLVKVADGGSIQCDTQILNACWSVQDYQFYSDLKVFPLSHFDVIIGMDWLEAHSPMKVDWRQKWLAVPYQHSTVVLYGSQAVVPVGSVVRVAAVLDSVPDASMVALPSEIQQLLQEFQSVFAVPSGLPPSRHCDHAVPLLPGASPVNIRPYRYPPVIKDEIER